MEFNRPHKTKSGRWYQNVDGKRYWGRTAREVRDKVRATGKETPLPKDPIIVLEIVEAWQEVSTQHRTRFVGDTIGSFETFFGRTRLTDVDRAALERYAEYLKGLGNGPQTIRHKVRLAKRIFRWAHEHDEQYISQMPRSPKLPPIPQGHKSIPVDDLTKLLNEMHPSSRLIYTFILATRCRPGEACDLKWSMLDLKRKRATFEEHKTAHSTGEPRTLLLNPTALECINAAYTSSGHVFFALRFLRLVLVEVCLLSVSSAPSTFLR